MFTLIARLLNRLRQNTNPYPDHISEVEIIRSMLVGKESGVMVDVGAHFGESLHAFSKLGWQVLAFEPDSNPSKQEAIHQKLNSRSKVFPLALSDSPGGNAVFYRSEVSTGISGLIPFHESHQAVESVEMETLKAVLEREGVHHVDFLKIDTEGNDLLVLRGLDWAVKPDVILCEFEDAKTKLIGYTFRHLGDYLSAAGYEVYVSEWHPIVRYGMQHRWRALRKYPCELAESGGWGNFIAFLPAKSDEFARAVAANGIKIAQKK